MKEEVSQFLIKDLRWEDNLLIRQADDFIIGILIKSKSSGQYEWTAKSKAPEPLERSTWAEPLGITANETYEACIAKFFNEITDLTIEYNGNIPATNAKLRCRWRAFNREQIEKNRNPDIVLVEHGTDPVKWVNVLATVEVKWRDQSDLLQKATEQLGDVAALVFYHQPDRQWFPCLSLCG
ncbi:hypothetical protein AZE42_02745 [Rhizopogon vesiculosus]|uniref:Fungal-type protein kinase domain-containing protein n=1 Tax=Rhizopogon vesiculosus TaxID=180088 RepID=A0A1J8PJB4_9AGAM|nr:hypothetical protein AZE42_02745 [Rhizopogon vesiculosus]